MGFKFYETDPWRTHTRTKHLLGNGIDLEKFSNIIEPQYQRMLAFKGVGVEGASWSPTFVCFFENGDLKMFPLFRCSLLGPSLFSPL